MRHLTHTDSSWGRVSPASPQQISSYAYSLITEGPQEPFGWELTTMDLILFAAIRSQPDIAKRLLSGEEPYLLMRMAKSA